MRGKRRYRCKSYYYTITNGHNKYDNATKRLPIYLNMVRRISHILNIPLAACFSWIKKAGQIVNLIVKERKNQIEYIKILEIDELYTFIKKTYKKCNHLI